MTQQQPQPAAPQARTGQEATTTSVTPQGQHIAEVERQPRLASPETPDIMSSAYGVGNTGQGAILAGPHPPDMRPRGVPEEALYQHHMSVEEAVAVAAGHPWPSQAVLISHMSGGDVNPSPTEVWFNATSREWWWARSWRNFNQW